MKRITGKMLMLAFLALAAAKSSTQQYGSYCEHSDRYGARPVDELDRICQIHDICTAALSAPDTCFCDEQFYARLSLYTPITDVQKAEWVSGLHNTYLSIAGCDNYWSTAYQHFIAGCSDSACGSRGYTYLPVYPYKDALTKYLWVFSANNARAFLVSLETYNRFVLLANQFPRNTYQYFTPTEYQEILLDKTRIINVTMQTVLIFVNADGDKTAGVAFIENYILTDYILTKLDEQTKELNETIGSFVKTVSDLNNENDSLKSKGALWKNIALAFIPFSGGTVIILAAVLIHIRHQRGQIARHIESAGLQSISMEEPEIETGNKLLSPIQGNA